MDSTATNKQKKIAKYISMALLGTCVSAASVVSMADTDPALSERIEEFKADLQVARPEVQEAFLVEENSEMPVMAAEAGIVSEELDLPGAVAVQDNANNMAISTTEFDDLKTNLAKSLKNLVLEQEALFNTLNSLNHESGQAKIDVIETQQKTKILQDDIKRTQEQLNKSFGISETRTDELYGELKDLYYQKKQAVARVASLKKKQIVLTEEIREREAELASIDSRSEREILSTKSKVSDALSALFSSSLPINYTGSVKCNTNIALKACLNNSKVKENNIRQGLAVTLSDPKYTTVVSNLSLDDIVFDAMSFNYKEAYQDFTGVTNFMLDAKVLVNVDSNMLNNMYDYVGIPQTGRFQVTLDSNVKAKFYIDGRYVGTGKVVIPIDLGQHDVKAVYEGEEQSTKEFVRKNRTLFYNFSSADKKKMM